MCEKTDCQDLLYYFHNNYLLCECILIAQDIEQLQA